VDDEKEKLDRAQVKEQGTSIERATTNSLPQIVAGEN